MRWADCEDGEGKEKEEKEQEKEKVTRADERETTGFGAERRK